MLKRTDFHKTKKSYTLADKEVTLDQSDVPNAKKGMIPHWACIRLSFSDLDLDNAATVKDLWTDVLCKVFYKLNLSMNNSKFLIESCDGGVLQLMKDLYMRNQSWRVSVPIANGQKFYPEILIPLTYSMDEGVLVHACDLFYNMKFEYDYAKATAGITINAFKFDVFFDLLWWNQRITSPVRKWQWHQGANNGVTLPNNGRHQFVTLMKPAGVDSNLWADGFDVSGVPNNFGVTSSLPLQRAYGADMWPGADDGVSDFAGRFKDHYCPLIYTPDLKAADGLSTELTVIRRKGTDPVPDVYALTVI